MVKHVFIRHSADELLTDEYFHSESSSIDNGCILCRMEEGHTILECQFDNLQCGATCNGDFGLEMDVVFWLTG